MASDTFPAVDFLYWPTEIWANTFSGLKASSDRVWHAPRSPAILQASPEVITSKLWHDLRLVCRKFNQILCMQSNFLTSFVYHRTDASLFMSKLLAYLRADRQIHALACTSNSPCLGMLLPQLLVSPARLKYLSISSVTAATVTCLSAYTGLLTCELYKPSEDSLNLQPLAALSNLKYLLLHEAHFHGLQLGDHLSGLFVNNASVMCELGSAELPGLQNMSVIHSEVCLPGIGLGACTALTRLEMQSSKVTNAEDQNSWYEVMHHLPQSMSKMVSLANLSVTMERGEVSLEQFGMLPALTRLHLLHTLTSSLVGDVTGLSRLKKLVATHAFHDSANSHHFPALSFDFNWEHLKELQAVQITGPTTLGSSILRLGNLPQLMQFQLLSFMPGDTMTEQNVAALSELFAEQRPEVHMVIVAKGK